jgi:hypothetical protein
VRSLHVDGPLDHVDDLLESVVPVEREVLNEKSFKRTISVERRRTERSKEPFLLMLMAIGEHRNPEESGRVLLSIVSVLNACCRETDVIGWYKDQFTIGIMFTGLLIADKSLILNTILSRVSEMLRHELTFDQFDQISLSFHFFPDDWDGANSHGPTNTALYPDLANPGGRKHSLLIVKRTIDQLSSALGLVVLSPLFLVIALAIKLTSKGPVFFKQQRLGQYGRLFTLFKFRSMHIDSDQNVHKDYVMRLIANQADRQLSSANGECVYKLTDDRRITTLGKILRRTSLDELPQIINVLNSLWFKS